MLSGDRNRAYRWLGLVLVLVAPFLLAGCDNYKAQLMRYPYLTDLVGTSVAVNFATDTSSTSATVRWGPVAGDGSCNTTNSVSAVRTSITVGTTAEYQWKAILGFPASGRYCYRPWLGSVDLLGADPTPVVTTQVPAGSSQPFSFVVFGDWGQTDSAGNNADTTNLVKLMAGSGARFGVTVGDNGYPAGSQTNEGDLRQTGQDVSAIFGKNFWAKAGAQLPLFLAPGNHGFSSGVSTRTTEMINFPQDVAVATSGGRFVRETYCCVNGTTSASYPSAWYAFSAGGARFYVLSADWADSNVGTGTVYSDDYAAHWTKSSPQYQWLKADLQAHPSGLKFAFFHFPLYSDQKAQSSDTYLQGPDSLEGLLAANHVTMSFSGHAHMYQRNVATGPGTFPNYVTGGGGGTLQPIAETGCSPSDAYGIGWSPTRSRGSACGAAPVPDAANRVYHFLEVTVNGSSVTVTPTDSAGRTFDVVTYDTSATTLPQTTIESGPPATGTSTDATFSFDASLPDSTFECSLDSAPFAGCASPASYSGLAGGHHTFAVRAVDAAGPDPVPATYDFALDLSPPAAPTGLTLQSVLPRAATVGWTAATDDIGVASYRIERDGAPVATVDAGTTSYTDPSLQDATTYSYDVVAVDGVGHESPPSDPLVITTPSDGVPVFSDGFESGDMSAWSSWAGLAVQGDVVHEGSLAAVGATTDGRTYAKRTLPSTYPDAWARTWFDVESASDQVNLLRLRTAADASIGYVFVTPQGNLGFRNDVAGTNTVSATVVSPGWHALELHMVVNGPSGTVEVLLDGVAVADLGSTGANLGTVPVGAIQIGEVQSGRTYTVAFDRVGFDVARLGP